MGATLSILSGLNAEEAYISLARCMHAIQTINWTNKLGFPYDSSALGMSQRGSRNESQAGYLRNDCAETAIAPTAAEIAAAVDIPIATVEKAIRELFRKRLLVLVPGTTRIRMAPPFSAVETPFRVFVKGKSYFANCVWDALGVAAALHSDGKIEACCGDCGTPMSICVRGGKPGAQDCVIHFAVPAAHWWDDIIYT